MSFVFIIKPANDLVNLLRYSYNHMYLCIYIIYNNNRFTRNYITCFIVPICTIFICLFVSFMSISNLTSFSLQITLTNTTGDGLLDYTFKLDS